MTDLGGDVSLTIESTRFGTVHVPSEAVVEFPMGLIGLAGSKYALISRDDDSPFAWLHSLEDPALALPITNPWGFFADYEVELSDSDSDRVDAGDVTVWVTVRAGSELADFSANLRAPILISGGQGFQVINEASPAPVRAALFPEAKADQAAA